MIFFSTEGEARTPDTWFWRPVLYQLSYFRVCGCKGKRIFCKFKFFFSISFFSEFVGFPKRLDDFIFCPSENRSFEEWLASKPGRTGRNHASCNGPSGGKCLWIGNRHLRTRPLYLCARRRAGSGWECWRATSLSICYRNLLKS